MPSQAGYTNVALCDACARFSRFASLGDIVLCRECVARLQTVLSDGYLSPVDLVATDLFDVHAEDEEHQVRTFPRYIVHRRNINPDDVTVTEPSQDHISMALSFFADRNINDIAIIGFDDRYSQEVWTQTFSPLFTADQSMQRDIFQTIGITNCDNCHQEMIRHTLTPGRRNSRQTLNFCSRECRNAFSSCSECGEISRAANLLRPLRPNQSESRSSVRLCPGCYERSQRPCHLCNQRTSRFEMMDVIGPTGNITSICPVCYHANLSNCNHCGRAALRWDMLSQEPGDEALPMTLCNRCAERWESRVHTHDYRPQKFIHHGTPPLYGIELEVDFQGRAPSRQVSKEVFKLSEQETFFYLKHDGTLENGFELVFHPRSINSWVDVWPTVDEIIAFLINKGAKAYHTETCGFHIHRSRWDLTHTSYVKLCLLLKRWKGRVIKVAQRNNSRYAGWRVLDERLPSGPGTSGSKRFKSHGHRFVKSSEHNMQRYQCVNFGSNPDSIEFRMYKGSLFAPTLKAYLGFTHQFVEFAHSLLVTELDMTHRELKSKLGKDPLWTQFTERLFKRQNHPFMPELLNHLHRREVGHESWLPTLKKWEEV